MAMDGSSIASADDVPAAATDSGAVALVSFGDLFPVPAGAISVCEHLAKVPLQPAPTPLPLRSLEAGIEYMKQRAQEVHRLGVLDMPICFRRPETPPGTVPDAVYWEHFVTCRDAKRGLDHNKLASLDVVFSLLKAPDVLAVGMYQGTGRAEGGVAKPPVPRLYVIGQYEHATEPADLVCHQVACEPVWIGSAIELCVCNRVRTSMHKKKAGKRLSQNVRYAKVIWSRYFSSDVPEKI